MAGKIGKGAKFEYSSDAGANWTKLTQVTKIAPFKIKGDAVDTTDMDSIGSYREKVGALIDAGQMSMDANYDNGQATHGWMTDNVNVSYLFRVTFPGSNPGRNKVQFAGFVNEVSPELPHDNKMTCAFAVTLSGAPTWSS